MYISVCMDMYINVNMFIFKYVYIHKRITKFNLNVYFLNVLSKCIQLWMYIYISLYMCKHLYLRIHV